jgi:S-(hydroxymethyl)glutathione dehydrogenase/alcohol dehydrogenase
MKCRAAVLRGVGMDWEIRAVDLDPPHSGEVVVRMAVAGVCHSDDHLFTGDVVPTPEVLAASGQPAPDWFPLLGGHEGAGVVEGVGPGVTTVQPGDHVALSFIPACGNCRFCVNGQSYICDIGASRFVREMPTDGTCRRHLGDENLLAYGQLGTFAEYAVLSERSVIKIDDTIPFHAARVVRCQHRLGLRDGVGRDRTRRHRGSHRHRWCRHERPASSSPGRRNLSRRGGPG